MMLGPVSSENEGAGSGIGRVRAFSPGDSCVLVLAWRRCLGCAGTWVTRGEAISAPGCAGVFARGSRGSGGVRAVPRPRPLPTYTHDSGVRRDVLPLTARRRPAP